MQLLILLSTYPAYLVGAFFIKHDPGPPEPKKELRNAFFFGVLSIAIALVVSLAITYGVTGDWRSGIADVAIDSAMPFVMAIAIFAFLEEIAKFVPIAIYLIKKPFFNEHTDGIIYFATVGLTFGAIENFLYGFGAGESGAGLVLARLVIGLFFHGALTSIAGYIYARAHVRHQSLWAPVLGLIGVSLIHTAYNFFAYSLQDNSSLIFGIAGIAIAVNTAMFWMFFVASENDMKMGLAGPQFQQPQVTTLQPQQQVQQPQPPLQHPPQMNQGQ